MSSDNHYRVGIIGCGLIAGGHRLGYRSNPATTVVAGADPSKPQRAKFLARYPGLRMYSDAREMLEAEKPDLVSVCTWPPLHAPLVVLAAESGVKGILCEKPMAVNLEEADRMVAACERNGVKLVISHQRRFNKRYMEAKAALKAGRIGDLVEIRGMCGGDLLTDGTHNIDLIRYFADDEPIKWVMGQINRRPWGTFGKETSRYGHQVEAATVARFDFANGVRGIMETGECSRPVYQRIFLEGTKGWIEVDGDRGRDGGPSGWRIWAEGQAGWEEHVIEQEANAFGLEIEEMLRWIEQGGEHLLSGQSARADTEVLMAVYESARQRSAIELPLNVQENPLEAMVEAGEI
jgi:predicted dehydrogenase